jgi:hypothetical protein
MLITFPLLTVVDDSGAIVTGADVAVAAFTDKAGVAIPAPGYTLNLGADPFVSIDYDAEAKGEAIVTLAISKVGSTFTGLNAAPRFYLVRDSGRLLVAIPAAAPAVAGGLPTVGGAGKVPATVAAGDGVDAAAALARLAPAPESLLATVASATATSVTVVAAAGTAFNPTPNAYAGLPSRYLAFTSGLNRGIVVVVASSSVVGANLLLGFAAHPGLVAAAPGDSIRVD